MKNPLMKRIPKEFRQDFGKYCVLLLFMTISIGFVSGALVAGDSMIQSYQDGFETYNIEDGNFQLNQELPSDVMDQLKDEATIYPNYYIEEEVKGEDHQSELRIFVNRDQVNRVCLMEGEYPVKSNEIALDRMYATNNHIEVGDQITVGGQRQTVTGYVALPDYSALFSDNGDSMFDAIQFGVAIMTKDGFDTYNQSDIHYSYSWKYVERPSDDQEEKKQSEHFLEQLNQNVQLIDYVPCYVNQAIQFAGDDLGKDTSMFEMLFDILMVILSFVFAVTTNNTIVKEANVIGTLRASGYTKGEVIIHYMSMPLILTVISSLLGNILGYSVMKDLIADLYYGSYSLTTYETIWNAHAFITTTAIPFFIILIINFVAVTRKMSLSPLKFLRRDLARKQKKKTIYLPKFSFFHRYRIRIILQNIPGYITLLFGICFANILLLFGMMMVPMIEKYQDQVIDNQIASYQYILKAPIETKQQAEKYAVTSLKTVENMGKVEDISVYGIRENSQFVNLSLKQSQVYISDGFADKYSLKIGDSLTLKECYGEKEYEFKVTGIYNYPAALCVFLNINQFNQTFDFDEDYYCGYFSNQKIEDIDENYIQTTITQDDLTKMTRQLKSSMGSMFEIVNVFAVVLYILLIFLLAKLVLEKNTTSISMVKILGYKNSEIRKLYLSATSIAVIIFFLVSLPITTLVMEAIYRPMLFDMMTGWMSFYIEPVIYPNMFAIGMVSYFVIEIILYQRIKKIPMSEALKNVD